LFCHTAFYFAAEEYVMNVVKPQEPALILWITDDVVMLGVNQIAKAECDLIYAKEAGIDIVRRPSGGGAIFTDSGTLQYTVIVPYEENSDVRDYVRVWLAEPLTQTLAGYGISASYEGRNDVVIDGRKISGTAQHIRGGYICSHGSLLFDTDLEKLVRVLTVDREKIQTKAVASVSARVTKIIDHIHAKKDGEGGSERPVPAVKNTELRDFREAFIRSYAKINLTARREAASSEFKTPDKENGMLHESPANNEASSKAYNKASNEASNKASNEANNEAYNEAYKTDGDLHSIKCLEFTPDELTEIEKIREERYANPEWTFGRDPAFTFTNKKRFPGGGLEVFLDVKGDVIQSAKITGDFLALRPIAEIEKRMEGVRHNEEALREALRSIDITPVLGSITPDELFSVLV